jgi:hypothetical protein
MPIQNLSRRQELNRAFPFESMIRWPHLQRLEDIPIEYMENCLDLSRFLKDSLGVSPGAPFSRVADPFRKILEHSELFTAWMLECHRQICLGAEGNRPYQGKSSVNVNPSNLAGKLRDRNSHIFAVFRRVTQRNVFNIASPYRDPLAAGVTGFEEWEKTAKEQGVLEYLTLEGIEGRGMEALDRAQLPGPYLEATVDEQIPSKEAYHPDLCGNLLHQAPGSEVIFYYYPGCEFIPKYFDRMRQRLVEILDAVSQRDLERMLRELAGFYQAGIRSQAVTGIWNSMLMGQVNELLELAGYGRLSHMEIDIWAFCLREEVFFRFFPDLVTGRFKVRF